MIGHCKWADAKEGNRKLNTIVILRKKAFSKGSGRIFPLETNPDYGVKW